MTQTRTLEPFNKPRYLLHSGQRAVIAVMVVVLVMVLGMVGDGKRCGGSCRGYCGLGGKGDGVNGVIGELSVNT